MGIVYQLAKRNTKVYLRDRTAVFFSLLSMFIIIGLYAFFLGDTNVSAIKGMVTENVEGIRFLVDSWIMAGILVVNSITVTLGVFGIMIEDEYKKRLSGFLVSPISRGKLVTSYLIAAWIVGFVMCLISLALAELYIVASGGAFLTLMQLLQVIGLIAVNVFSSSCLVFLLATFVHTSGGFATLSTILGTVIGFLTGIYIPIGILPAAVQNFIKFVPASHGTALMRQVFATEPLAKVFAGAPADVLQHFRAMYGITLQAGGKDLPAGIMMLVLAGSGVLFLLLSIIKLQHKKLK